jgi:hypothetical protein
MTDNLRDLYEQIDRLDRSDKERLRAYLDQQIEQPQIVDEDTQTKISALMAAVENFWGDMPQEEIDAIVEDMNSEYIEPLSDADWLDHEAKN